MIEVKNLKKKFGKTIAIDDVSFEIHKGETLGLVGESGCGKSTLGRTLLGLEKQNSGDVFFEKKELSTFSSKELKLLRKEMQIIFQDPYASLNPRMTASDIIAEPLDIHRLTPAKHQREEKILELLSLVGLPSYMRSRFPHEFSGGQRQRIGIARALASSPKFIVCDEPISALDVSVQAQIINLLKKLQMEMGLTYLFIAHDLAMVKYLSTRVAVMYLGHIVELGFADDLYNHPKHPYTEALLSAIPIPDPLLERARHRIILKGELPSSSDSPKGCVFASRCPHATDHCRAVRPEWKEVAPNHFTACHLIK
ncbi:MAG: oligopeptide/dipeptide ABC transporter ATP-binding protein [Chlamydiota bacterium]